MAKYKKRADGRYCTTVWDGTYTPQGTKHRKTLYAKTIRELDAKVREMERLIEENGVVEPGEDTFLSYCAGWLMERELAESTRDGYRYLIEHYFAILGDVKIKQLTPRHVKILLNSVKDKAAISHRVMGLFYSIVKTAMKKHLIGTADGCDILDSVPKIKIHAKEKRLLTPGEKAAVFTAKLSPADRCFLLLIYGCGLRREEVLALTPFSFDFKAWTVTITRAVAFSPYGVIHKEPKSRRGFRTIPLPESIRSGVKEYVDSCSGSLYPDITQAVYIAMWNRIVRAIRAECPDSPPGLSAHMFRHNFCTELCYQIPTISLKNVARLLGDSEAMVLNVYSHIDLEREPTADVISAAF